MVFLFWCFTGQAKYFAHNCRVRVVYAPININEQTDSLSEMFDFEKHLSTGTLSAIISWVWLNSSNCVCRTNCLGAVSTGLSDSPRKPSVKIGGRTVWCSHSRWLVYKLYVAAAGVLILPSGKWNAVAVRMYEIQTVISAPTLVWHSLLNLILNLKYPTKDSVSQTLMHLMSLHTLMYR